MVTFDSNGTATVESQAFVQQQVNDIINNPQATPARKESQLRDLYNQYGLVYGTYRRAGGGDDFGEFLDSDFKRLHPGGGASSASLKSGLMLMIILLAFLFYMPDFDSMMKGAFDINISKAIESFFQWVFGG